MSVWAAVVAGALGCYLLKLAGLSVPEKVLDHPVAARVADHIPVALLAALVALGLPVEVVPAPAMAAGRTATSTQRKRDNDMARLDIGKLLGSPARKEPGTIMPTRQLATLQWAKLLGATPRGRPRIDSGRNDDTRRDQEISRLRGFVPAARRPRVEIAVLAGEVAAVGEVPRHHVRPREGRRGGIAHRLGDVRQNHMPKRARAAARTDSSITR